MVYIVYLSRIKFLHNTIAVYSIISDENLIVEARNKVFDNLINLFNNNCN